MEVVILAAGKGTRMHSRLPKVLHQIGGAPMLDHVLARAVELQPKKIHVVVGFEAELIREQFQSAPCQWVLQSEQLGTGHAVQQAVPDIDCDDPDNVVLVLFGDVPLIQGATLEALLSQAGPDSLGLLTVVTGAPDGFGRIIRDDSAAVQAIVEHKDATAEQRLINEVNTGIMAIPAARLKQWLGQLQTNNRQGEYYLTDIVALARESGCEIQAVQAAGDMEVMGVNNKTQLALLERHYQALIADQMLAAGVTLRDPSRLDVRGDLRCGTDVEIDINNVFAGQVALGDNVRIEANCVIKDAVIGDNSVILAGSQIEGAEIGQGVSVGPMARIRPGTVLGDGVKIGNFVETKKAVLGSGSKANHLAYLGDTELGSGCNIGAGTIFCNYDGVNKHQTNIGDNVFVGSNSTLVAPVNLSDGSFVAAGSAINTDVPADNLAVGRSKQRNISGWKRPGKPDKK